VLHVLVHWLVRCLIGLLLLVWLFGCWFLDFFCGWLVGFFCWLFVGFFVLFCWLVGFWFHFVGWFVDWLIGWSVVCYSVT
jgi:hypothetical protein